MKAEIFLFSFYLFPLQRLKQLVLNEQKLLLLIRVKLGRIMNYPSPVTKKLSRFPCKFEILRGKSVFLG